jgi:hypothetical protein
LEQAEQKILAFRPSIFTKSLAHGEEGGGAKGINFLFGFFYFLFKLKQPMRNDIVEIILISI